MGGGVVECEGYGEEREWSGEAAGGEVGIHEEEGGAGDGECPPGREEGDAGELGGVADGEEAAEDLAGGEEGEPDAEEVEQEEVGGEREMRDADEGCDGGSEEGEALVFGDEGGVMREECGVEEVFDAGDVEAAVFGEGMEAVGDEGRESEGGEEECPDAAGPEIWGCGVCHAVFVYRALADVCFG